VDEDSRVRQEEIVAAGRLTRRSFGYPDAPALGSAPVKARSIRTGPFVTAREDGDLAVALAAEPAPGGRLRLSVTVIGPDGTGMAGLRVGLALRSGRDAEAAAAACGPGCYRASLPLGGAPRSATVRIRQLGRLPSAVTVGFPAAWPPPPAAALARRATRVFDALSSITIDERLASSATSVTHTFWRLEAPNRLSYTIRGGSQAVIVGPRRWDRDPGADWRESPQTPVRQPTPTWGGAPAHAALLGATTVDGAPALRISFADPKIPAWYTLTVDRRTLRTLRLDMIAPAHFMHHAYGGFDAPRRIRPPA
jgi:hypothetical protein